jgi:hypothetical protein
MNLSFSTATYVNQFGAPLANTPVLVLSKPNADVVTVYANSNASAVQTMVTNGSGVFSFYAPAGSYTVAVGNYNFNAVLAPNPILHAVKPISTQRASTVTVTADPHLVLPLAANSTYALDSMLFNGGLDVADFRLTFTGPAGATIQWAPIGPSAATTGDPTSMVLAQGGAGTEAVVGIYPTGSGVVRSAGVVIVGATAGNVSLAWAQGTTNATPVTLASGSWIRASKLN